MGEITQSAKNIEFFKKDNVQQKFIEAYGNASKSKMFLTSLIQVVASNQSISNCTTTSIYNAAMMSTALDLPINNNLGHAWIVPYKTNKKGKDGTWTEVHEAQYQIGWKGFVQLAIRSGQYTSINVVEVYENQFKSYNSLTESLNANFSLEGSGKVVGVVAYFSLKNGFEKTSFWTIESIKKHAKTYSTYGNMKNGKLTKSPWNDPEQFIAMGKKTVLKNILKNWGVLSIEMQKAMTSDQGIIEDYENGVVNYPDNEQKEASTMARPVSGAAQSINEEIDDAEIIDDDEIGSI